MAKETSYYFSHDYNANTDVKCLFLRQQLGMEGYGIFWFLIESLATAGGTLPLKLLPVLAMQMQVTEAKVSAVIHGFDLFIIGEDSFSSNRLNIHLNLRKSLSEFGRKGVQIREAKRDASCPPSTGAKSPPSNNPSSKKRKEKKIVYTPPAVEEVENYFTENGYTKEAGNRAWKHYDVANWTDTQGKPVKSWKQKMHTNWFKPENQATTQNPSSRKIEMVL